MPVRRVVIDHMNLGVSDLARARDFYLAALAPLGFVEQTAWKPEAKEVGIGPDDLDDLYLVQVPVVAPIHVAFAADSAAEVDLFHAAALAAGGTDNGAPGLRPQYSGTYYGAFVLDPDGHNAEAVFHAEGPEELPTHDDGPA